MVRRWHALPYEENLTPGLRAFPSLTWILDVSKLLPIYVQLGEFASPFRTFVRLPSPICGFPWAGVVCGDKGVTWEALKIELRQRQP